MPALNATQARKEFAETLNRWAVGKERVILKRRGKGIAAAIPIEDLLLLEEMEDRIDLNAARKVRDDPTEGFQPWEAVKAELRL